MCIPIYLAEAHHDATATSAGSTSCVEMAGSLRLDGWTV